MSEPHTDNAQWVSLIENIKVALAQP